MLENNRIKYSTETTGFLVIIINIPEKRETTVKAYKKPNEKPLNAFAIKKIFDINLKFFLSFLFYKRSDYKKSLKLI